MRMKIRSFVAMAVTVALFPFICPALSESNQGTISMDAVQKVIEAIDNIGDVTVNSGKAIEKAELYYNLLTDSEKIQITNRFDLADAKLQYDILVTSSAEEKAAAIYNNAKSAYDKLNEASALCISGMNDVYNSWYFGVYKAKDCTSSNVVSKLVSEINYSFSSSTLESVMSKWYISAYSLTSDWQNSVNLINYAHYEKGTYEKLRTLLSEAQSILQELTNTYADYSYYPSLKEYYAVVSSYVDFFENPSGSFSQLADTVKEYENKIRTYQTDIGFLF